jgi:hypothetical protein
MDRKEGSLRDEDYGAGLHRGTHLPKSSLDGGGHKLQEQTLWVLWFDCFEATPMPLSGLFPRVDLSGNSHGSGSAYTLLLRKSEDWIKSLMRRRSLYRVTHLELPFSPLSPWTIKYSNICIRIYDAMFLAKRPARQTWMNGQITGSRMHPNNKMAGTAGCLSSKRPR